MSHGHVCIHWYVPTPWFATEEWNSVSCCIDVLMYSKPQSNSNHSFGLGQLSKLFLQGLSDWLDAKPNCLAVGCQIMIPYDSRGLEWTLPGICGRNTSTSGTTAQSIEVKVWCQSAVATPKWATKSCYGSAPFFTNVKLRNDEPAK